MTDCEYLGDGVYVGREYGSVILLTEGPDGESDSIVLDTETIVNLLSYLKKTDRKQSPAVSVKG